jgi:hypothetical protein
VFLTGAGLNGTLYVSNGGSDTTLQTVIQDSPPHGFLDQLSVQGNAYVSLQPTGSGEYKKFPISELTGDSTGLLLLANGSILTSNSSKILTNIGVENTPDPRATLVVAQVTLSVSNGSLDYTDIIVEDGGHLRLSEGGTSARSENVLGVYTFVEMFISGNSSVVFNYNDSAVPQRLRKRKVRYLSGISLHVLSHLILLDGGRIHSDEQVKLLFCLLIYYL